MSRGTDLAQPQSTEELITLLERESATRRENVRMAKWGSICLVLTLFGLALFAWLAQGTPFLEALGNYSAFFLVALGGVALTASHRKALLQVHTEDPRLAGFLIEVLSYRDPEIVEHAERMLPLQLPQLLSLSVEHGRTLSARLVRSNNLDFIQAALTVLRSHGGAECLDGIAALSERKPLKRGREQFERLRTLSLKTSADIRLRSAKMIIDAEAKESQLRLDIARAGQGVALSEQTDATNEGDVSAKVDGPSS